MPENIEEKLKRLQGERDASKKDREDVQQQLGEIGERLKHLRDGQKKRQRQLDEDIKKGNNQRGSGEAG